MKARTGTQVLAASMLAALVVALAWTLLPQPRDVASSAPAAQRPASTAPEGVLATYEAEYERERERLAALPTAELRSDIGRLHREVSDMAGDRRRHIDEEGSYDARDVAMYDSALRDLRSDLDTAYYELEKRGELSPADEVVRQRDVDVEAAREDVEGSRADRDRYAREGRTSPDYDDERSIRSADVSMAEASLQASEARLRIAERASAVPEQR